MKPRLVSFLLPILMLILCIPPVGSEPPSPHGALDPITVHLSSERQLYQLGETVLLYVEVVNNTGKKISLVMPQGGSDRAWQYPQGVFELKDPQGRKDVFSHVPRCKTMDPLLPDAFFSLAPGQTRKLYKGGYPLNLTYQMDKPGVYNVIYRYSTVANKEWQWYGAYSDDCWEKECPVNEFWKKREALIEENRHRLAEVEKISTRSEWVQIEIAERLTSEEDALKTAEEICAANKWPWRDVAVIDRDRFWDVVTKKMTLGGNAFIRIDKKSGRVVMHHLTGP